MRAPQLVLLDVDQPVYRVGYAPEPWAWAGWEFAGTDGRFPGRWDDHRGLFRTIYAGSTLLGCLLEVLAHFRPDPALAAELDAIGDDETSYPTAPAGVRPLQLAGATRSRVSYAPGPVVRHHRHRVDRRAAAGVHRADPPAGPA